MPAALRPCSGRAEVGQLRPGRHHVGKRARRRVEEVGLRRAKGSQAGGALQAEMVPGGSESTMAGARSLSKLEEGTPGAALDLRSDITWPKVPGPDVTQAHSPSDGVNQG